MKEQPIRFSFIIYDNYWLFCHWLAETKSKTSKGGKESTEADRSLEGDEVKHCEALMRLESLLPSSVATSLSPLIVVWRQNHIFSAMFPFVGYVRWCDG